MDNKKIYIANSPLIAASKKVSGCFVEIDEEQYYKIENVDLMPDFFMTIVSDSNHWMYISSNGSLTAGRINKEHALFPYYTEDKIHDYKGKTGSKTICLVEKQNITYLWEPFSDDAERFYRIERNLYKSIFGNKIIFEEHNLDLKVVFRYGWYNSDKYGWIKKSSIRNTDKNGVNINILDGLCNIMPHGIDYTFQNEFSVLADAYKKNELEEESKIGLFMLSAIPVDRAEPSEALKTTTVWSVLPSVNSKFLLSNTQLGAFMAGNSIQTESDVRAKRGAYFVNMMFTLDESKQQTWYLVAEVDQDACKVAALGNLIKTMDNIPALLEKDIAEGTKRLIKIVAKADGLQAGKEKLGFARHFSNTMFNIMRGGVFTNNYLIDTADLIQYIAQTNKTIAKRLYHLLTEQPPVIQLEKLLVWARKFDDSDLERICFEYLPLTFSRRHGDPSRPWNQFSIETKNNDGSDKLNYQGNWRDIFQNWEALCVSFPEFTEGIIAKFVNASTPDGYNPYRITRQGIDWECPDPEDPWAYIGYWGDHQIIYLLKLLELSVQYHPEKLKELLSKNIFVYANVPYRIKTFDQLVENPKDTIEFDHQLNQKINQLTELYGADGKLVQNKKGETYKVNLMEKILATLLSKISNFIPEAGIWLNTQRPEWNDANNALVGNGVSMVTLYYLRRFLQFWKTRLSAISTGQFEISEELNELFENLYVVLKSNVDNIEDGFSDKQRYNFVRASGVAGSNYRQTIYTHLFSGKKTEITVGSLQNFVDLSLKYLDCSIEKNRRNDGMFHAYNLVSFNHESINIRYLYEMLEGQVAVLSSGKLTVHESLELLDALKASKLFRHDQYSYILYPDRVLKRFTEKNIIPNELFNRSDLLKLLVSDNKNTIVHKDINGNFHFDSNFRNGFALRQALEKIVPDNHNGITEKQILEVLDIYETVFDHQSFTGRSGTFFGYEGLGSIYWHMVSKLRLAVQEYFFKAVDDKMDSSITNKLKTHYYEIVAGIGLYKEPDLYGAFPTDAYSHTPANGGAKQPGLTGQVKEDVISRFGELGIRVNNGSIYFESSLLNENEILRIPASFNYFDIRGAQHVLELTSGQLAFTFCQIPVVYSFNNTNSIHIYFSDGKRITVLGKSIGSEISSKIFKRNDEVKLIEVDF